MEVAKIFTTVYYIKNNKVTTEQLYKNIEQFNNTEINKGKIVSQQVGAASKESYKNMIDKALENA